MTDSSTSETITHEQRHRALVDRLARDLRPTKPLWPVKVRIAVWVALEIAVILFAGSMHSGRHDLRQQLTSPLYLAELISFVVAGVLAAALAFRSAIPGLEPSRAQWIVLGLVALGASLTLWAEPRVHQDRRSLRRVHRVLRVAPMAGAVDSGQARSTFRKSGSGSPDRSGDALYLRGDAYRLSD